MSSQLCSGTSVVVGGGGGGVRLYVSTSQHKQEHGGVVLETDHVESDVFVRHVCALGAFEYEDGQIEREISHLHSPSPGSR